MRIAIKVQRLNPIEPKWVHSKRAVVEPHRLKKAQEVRERVCEYFDCELLELIKQSQANPL